jgi:NADPH:quinone reductase-like Zn-dependent oxidoreductase
VTQLAKLEPFPLVLDCIGIIPLYHGSGKFLKPKRPYLTIGVDLHGLSTFQTMQAFLRLVTSATLPAFMGGAARKIQVYSMKWDEKALKELVGMLETGVIHVPIDGEYGWEKDDVMKAYERQMSARVSSKGSRSE